MLNFRYNLWCMFQLPHSIFTEDWSTLKYIVSVLPHRQQGSPALTHCFELLLLWQRGNPALRQLQNFWHLTFDDNFKLCYLAVPSLNAHLAPQGGSAGLCHLLYGVAWLPTEWYQYPGAVLLMSGNRKGKMRWKGDKENSWEFEGTLWRKAGCQNIVRFKTNTDQYKSKCRCMFLLTASLTHLDSYQNEQVPS